MQKYGYCNSRITTILASFELLKIEFRIQKARLGCGCRNVNRNIKAHKKYCKHFPAITCYLDGKLYINNMNEISI